MRIRLMVAAALVGMLVPAQLDAAPSGAPEPTVTASALDGSIVETTNCDGGGTTANPAALAVVRTGSTASPLEVDVAYSGTLTPGSDYPPQPDPVTIPAGTDRAILFVSSSNAGTVTLSVEAGAGYVVGDPSAATATVRQLEFEAECAPREHQTIRLGETPEAIDVYGLFGGVLADTVLEISGEVPPGLTFNPDGSFSGIATELGTFSFTARYCLGDLCALQLPVTIVVVPVGGGDPGPGPVASPPVATPATPVAGRSTFTG